MVKLPSRLPSPAMVVALLALVVALGGSAYAASKIGTKDIRRGAVTAAKLRPGAVTGVKIRSGAVGARQIAADAVTGEKVLEASLAEVPRADLATRALQAQLAEKAGTAQKAMVAETASEFDRYFATGFVTAAKGETVVLGKAGPFTITGTCVDLGGVARRSRTLIETSAANSYLVSDFNSYNEADFQPGMAAEIGNDIGEDEPTWEAGAENEEWLAASPDGSVVLRGQATNGAYMFGAECVFSLSWFEEG